jgi:hypothetical protein
MSSSRMPAMWFLTEALFLVTMSLVCAVAMAQTGGQKAGEPARGSTPPGMSQDGAKPSDGAIKGGSAVTGGTSIAPGETGGLPNRTPAESAEGRKRCNELTGSLRDECLEKERSATTAPRTPSEILKKP